MMFGPEEIDHVHDSFCEIAMKQQEKIARLGAECLELALENMALREDAEGLIREEHQRLVEALILVEDWIAARVRVGARRVDARAMLAVLAEITEYADRNVEPPWYEEAVRAMSGEL